MNSEPIWCCAVVSACLLMTGCKTPATNAQIAAMGAQSPTRNVTAPEAAVTTPATTSGTSGGKNQAGENAPATATGATGTPTSPGESVMAIGNKEFVELVTAEMAECEKNADRMGIVTAASRGTQLGIAGIGIIAGSIVVPALAAKATIARSTVAAWGGIAGAANAAQAALASSGLSPEQTVAVQKAYLADISKIFAEIKGLKYGPDSASFLLRLRFQCRMGVPLAPASRPDLLPDGTTPNG